MGNLPPLPEHPENVWKSMGNLWEIYEKMYCMNMYGKCSAVHNQNPGSWHRFGEIGYIWYWYILFRASSHFYIEPCAQKWDDDDIQWRGWVDRLTRDEQGLLSQQGPPHMSSLGTRWWPLGKVQNTPGSCLLRYDSSELICKALWAKYF